MTNWKTKRKEIQKLSEKELHSAIVSAGTKERRTAAESIAFLAESARRKDYSRRAYQSLGAYALAVMKVSSSSSAYRYAQAAWLSLEFPDTLASIEKGELTLEAAAMAWQAFREKKSQAQKLKEKIQVSPEFNLGTPENQKSKKLTKETKTQIIENLKNKTHAQAQKTIAVAIAKATGENREIPRPRGKTRPQGAKWNEMSFYLSDEELELFQRLRGLLSHKVGDTDLNSTFLRMLTEGLEKHDPVEVQKRKEKRKAAQAVFSRHEKPRVISEKKQDRFPSAEDSRKMWIKEGLACIYQDSVSKQQCGTRLFLDRDHREPYSKGGSSEWTNFQPLCAVHNRIVKRDLNL